MKVTETKLDGCRIIEPESFGDERGFFLETFNVARYKNLAEIDMEFVQDNHSRSVKNVLRGLHFQKNKPQGKLVRTVRGEVFDVAVDLRQDSATFGESISVILSDKNKKQVWIPPGFAHGFLVISDFADFEYKCTEYYCPEDECSILWSDSTLAIDWPCKEPTLSKKDLTAKSLSDLCL